MLDLDMVRVLGRSAFHDTALTSSGALAYLGGDVDPLILIGSFSKLGMCTGYLYVNYKLMTGLVELLF